MSARTSDYQAPQASLFDAPDDGSIPHPGQWRLARIELVNWGTFHGYHRIDVSRKGLLITGESGSGKSSILDAVACVLTPPRALRLNAAAQSEGARGRDRTLYSYIRGAWSNQADSAGEVSSSYLRPKAATWSGVALRYEEHPEHPAINLIALFHLKANSTGREGLSTLYAMINGTCELLEFQKYVEGGVDLKSLNRAFKGRGMAFRDHAPFAARFSRRMGLQGEKTLELLHRTQAAKNFGSLDELFRRFMLDEPVTFAQRDLAVEQFQALYQAYGNVVDQRRQMYALEPLINEDERAGAAQRKASEAQRLKRVLTAYTETRIITQLEQERERCRSEADRLEGEVRAAQAELDLAERAYGQAQAAFNNAGGFALAAAEFEVQSNVVQVGTIRGNRAKLQADLAALGAGELPTTAQGWGDLVRQVQKKAEEETQNQRQRRDADYAQYARVTESKERLAGLAEELRHLRSRRTNIPRKLDAVRMNLAHELGIAPSELPFVGELITVREEYAAWRGAIERVLGSQAKTLLVAHRYAPAVAHYIDGVHLGLRFEFEDVPEDFEVPQASPAERSLIRRVEVEQKSDHPEYSKWVHRLLRNSFDYICVDGPDELGAYHRALTRAGQVKNGMRYIKDDRHAVDDRSHWVLGASNEAKVDELVRLSQAAKRELAQAQEAARAADAALQRANDLQRLSQTLAGEAWESYDLAGAERILKRARDYYEQLRAGSGELAQAERAQKQAKEHRDAVDEQLRALKVEAAGTARELERVEAEIEGHQGRLATCEAPSEEDRVELSRLFTRAEQAARRASRRDASQTDAVSALYQCSTDVDRLLDQRAAAAADELRRSHSAIERLIEAYRRDWPAQAADLGAGFEARGEYLSVYNSIKASGLPAFEQRFLQVLNDFSQDQITAISTTIRGAIREIKDKIRQVNRSLALSEYAPGVHLQIDVRECRSAQVNDFLADLKAITQGQFNSTSLAAAEERYQRTAKVMMRLQSVEPADRRWQAECLDTRRHVSFRAKEVDDAGEVISVHESDTGLSGGQKQKLVIFCLAAALRYQLTDEESPVPAYGTVMLDEAFDKADHRFAATAMDIFEEFGFQMVLATPMKLLQTADDHIGGVAYVHCRDRKYSTVQLLSFEEDA